ncbi:hypothetical protein C493_15283 [Natronolimnohabitans innermongolicus JCM 12255]|uniref:Uncharacterized protein n=1 Tax=Natronolimnohabitans innermongolicus JCM 12255 TaxID=1227499 RepID=L9WU74_9EURY|nr:hypothetical protein C493_15283 [Natronolimnohabitans innermongolicus JCM 12255]
MRVEYWEPYGDAAANRLESSRRVRTTERRPRRPPNHRLTSLERERESYPERGIEPIGRDRPSRFDH